MTDPRDDEDWLGPLRDAVRHERTLDPRGLPTLEPAQREQLTASALEALRKPSAAPPRESRDTKGLATRRAWLRWSAPIATFAAAAALFVILRRPEGSSDMLSAYRTEISGVETVRASRPTDTLAIAKGSPFAVVLRPEREDAPVVRSVQVFLRMPDGIRDATVEVEIAATGAVRVSGRGEALAGARALMIVLSRREASPASLRSSLSRTSAGQREYPLSGDDVREARVFEVPVTRVD